MIIAIDTTAGTAVSAAKAASITNGQSYNRERGRYQCPFCDSPVAVVDDPCASFVHTHGEDCTADGNVSTEHQRGQQAVAKEVINRLPVPWSEIEIDLERRVNQGAQFVISDILVTAPVRLSIEVVVTHAEMSPRRRLQILSDSGYCVTFVLMTTSPVSATDVEQQLRPFEPADVGYCTPDVQTVEFGTVIKPSDVSMTALRHETVGTQFS